MAYKTIKPLKLKSNRLPLSFQIYIPSTQGDSRIGTTKFNARIKEEKKFFDEKFKGDTSIQGLGSYLSPNKDVITEDVALLEVDTTTQKFNENRESIINRIKQKQKEWGQNSILYKIEGQTFIYPKQKFIDSEDENKDIKVD